VAVVQALELLNGTALRDLLGYGALIDQALASKTPREAIQLLYRAALNREPAERELNLAVEFLGSEPWTTAATAPAAESVWFDDEPPAGAHLEGTHGAKSWHWVKAAKLEPHSGRRSHSGGEVKDEPYQHYFLDAAPGWIVHPSERLYTYVYIDPAHLPREIMIQWNDGTSVDGGWSHRAFWGEDAIMFGQSGTPARRRLGPLPETGKWVRLEVPVAAVALGEPNQKVIGMSFDQLGGGIYWDESGILVGPSDPRSAGLADVLWALLVSPEFQYIR
jgi:phage terminase large subunit-like protein